MTAWSCDDAVMNAPLIPGFVVRPVTPADADAWAAYACLPEVKQHTSSTAATREDVEREIAKTLTGDPAAPMRFALLPEGEDRLVATVGFHTISPLNRTAEIAYDVTPERWGRDIASMACRAATRWGFEVQGWHRVQATVLLANLASQRVLERCGFRREGLLRSFRIVRGEPADYWMYAALPGEVA